MLSPVPLRGKLCIGVGRVRGGDPFHPSCLSLDMTLNLFPQQLWKQCWPERGRDLPKTTPCRGCTRLPIPHPGGGQSMQDAQDIEGRGPSSKRQGLFRSCSLLHPSPTLAQGLACRRHERVERIQGPRGVSAEGFREEWRMGQGGQAGFAQAEGRW